MAYRETRERLEALSEQSLQISREWANEVPWEPLRAKYQSQWKEIQKMRQEDAAIVIQTYLWLEQSSFLIS